MRMEETEECVSDTEEKITENIDAEQGKETIRSGKQS